MGRLYSTEIDLVLIFHPKKRFLPTPICPYLTCSGHSIRTAKCPLLTQSGHNCVFSPLMAICGPRDTAVGSQDTTPPYLRCHEIRQCGSLSCLRSHRSSGGTQNRQKPRAPPRLVAEA